MNALTQTEVRNPSRADDKVRAAWDRKTITLDKAIQGMARAERGWQRARAIYEQEVPDVPDIKWQRIGLDRELPGRIICMSAEEIMDRAQRVNQWTFPHLPEAELALEVAKVIEFKLRTEMADIKAGYSAASEAVDAAHDRRWTAQADLLLTPAPHFSAVQTKLEYLFGDETIDDDEEDRIPLWPRKFTDALIADVRRLNQQAKEA